MKRAHRIIGVLAIAVAILLSITLAHAFSKTPAPLTHVSAIEANTLAMQELSDINRKLTDELRRLVDVKERETMPLVEEVRLR